MKSVQIHKLIPKHVLVSRSSARSIETELAHVIEESQGELTLDFSGVGGITPSFFDEMLAIIGENYHSANKDQLKLTVENPPTQLSSKFIAVARGHNLVIKESQTGAWFISG